LRNDKPRSAAFSAAAGTAGTAAADGGGSGLAQKLKLLKR
jgi:hypothetical protein